MTEDRNIVLDFRWAAGDTGGLSRYAVDLIAAGPDVILVRGSPATEALRQATRTVPIVVVEASDVVATGFAATLARRAAT